MVVNIRNESENCFVINVDLESCIESCYGDYNSIYIDIYNNGFFNYSNLFLFVCLNEFIEIIDCSCNLKDDISERKNNRIVSKIKKIKPHETKCFYLKLSNKSLSESYIKIILFDQYYCKLADKCIILK